MDGYAQGPQEFTAEDLQRLDALGSSLAAKRLKAIDARVSSGTDQRWFEDIEAYEGRDEATRIYRGLRDQVQGFLQTIDPRAPKQSTIVVNVTRGKVNTDAARLQDIALPSDDRNWDLAPSTVPELVSQLGDKKTGLFKNGQAVMVAEGGQQRQATMADYAAMTMEEAKKRAKAMRDEIDDQLDASRGGTGYEGVVRQVMFDERLLGCGIAKGPNIMSRVRKVWMPISDGANTVHVLQRRQDTKPASGRVNPWDFYPHPDCGETPTRFPIWERIPGITAKDLRDYAGVPGYIPAQIMKVLLQGPQKPDHPPDKQGSEVVVTEDTVFEAWEYHGEIEREDLESAGCACPKDDPWKSYRGCVMLVNNIPIKAEIAVLDTGDLPYDVLVTNRRSGYWDGYGTAYLARMAQRAITAGWRAMMNNAGQFGGPQIVVNRTKIEPATPGDWQIRGGKVWLAAGDVEDVEKVFAVHEITAHQTEYAAIIKMGMEFLDRETSVPQIVEGEQGDATDVLGGMNLLLSAANINTKRDLKALDDLVTIPHIGRYVDWNMQYNPKTEIKGDFEVRALASGALMNTAEQNKNAGNLLAVISRPDVRAGIGDKFWDGIRRIVRSFRYEADDFIPDNDTIQKNIQAVAKNQPQDPRVEVANIRAKADMAETKLRGDVDLMIKMIDARMQNVDLSSAEKQLLEKLKVQLALSFMDAHESRRREDTGHLVDLHKHQNPPLKAPTEPTGRAKPGRSFQQ